MAKWFTTIVSVIALGLILLFIFPGLIIVAIPLLILFGPTLFYGYKSGERGVKRLLITVLIGLITGEFSLYFLGGICGIDGGSRCQLSWLNYLIFGLIGSIVSLPIMYIGVGIRNFFKDPV